MSYDSKCYQLAEEFLRDTPVIDSADNRDTLAQSIQDVIEQDIRFMFREKKNRLAQSGDDWK